VGTKPGRVGGFVGTSVDPTTGRYIIDKSWEPSLKSYSPISMGVNHQIQGTVSGPSGNIGGATVTLS